MGALQACRSRHAMRTKTLKWAGQDHKLGMGTPRVQCLDQDSVHLYLVKPLYWALMNYGIC